jgi:hypothetical protein
MPYFILQSPQGSLEVFAPTLQAAIELAGGNDPGMQGQVYAHPAFSPSGTAQPSRSDLTAVGFNRVVSSGANAAAGVGLGAGGGSSALANKKGVPGGALGGTDEATAQSFRSQFRRGLDASGETAQASPFRDFFDRQMAPFYDVFRLQSALGQEKGNPQDYVQAVGGGAGGLSQGLTGRAGTAYRELQRQNTASQGVNPNPADVPAWNRQQGIAPTSEQFRAADPGADLAGIISGAGNRAAREKYGTWGASFLPGEEEQYQRYKAQPVGVTGTKDRFLDFLASLGI